MDATSLLMGIGSALASIKAFKKAFGDSQMESLEQVQQSDKPMKVTTHNVDTIEQRVRYVIGMIQKGRDSAEVRRAAVQALSRKCGENWCVPEKNWEMEGAAIFDAVRRHVRYTRDTYGKDLFQHPARTLEFGGGDCDDFTIVLGSMYQAVGYPVRVRVIRTTDSEDFNHIYALVGFPPRDPTKWVPADGSVDQPFGWEAPAEMIAEKRTFNVP